MTALFGNLKSKAAQAEAPVDRVGGGFAALNTDIYVGNLKVAYVGKSDKGANFMQVIIEDVKNATTGVGASDYRETIYFTSNSEKGESPTYEKNGKQFFLPGYTVVNDMMVMTAGTELPDTVFEEKVVNIYDYDQKKELPKSVMVAVEAVGQQVAFAVYKTVEPKQAKGADGVYADTGEPREVNNIEKVFHAEYRLTLLEAAELGETDPTPEHAVYWQAWLDQHQGKVKDKMNKPGTGKPGVPPQAGNAGATGGSTAKKSLFGKK